MIYFVLDGICVSDAEVMTGGMSIASIVDRKVEAECALGARVCGCRCSVGWTAERIVSAIGKIDLYRTCDRMFAFAGEFPVLIQNDEEYISKDHVIAHANTNRETPIGILLFTRS